MFHTYERFTSHNLCAGWTALSCGLQLVPVFARSKYGQTLTETRPWSCFVSSDQAQEKAPTPQTKKKDKW